MIPRRFLHLAAALIVPALAAGCGQSDDTFAPICPTLALVKDGADITRFNGRGQDVTDLVVAGRITAVPAACSWGGRNVVKSSLRVSMSVFKGPAAQGRVINLPYFVAVTLNGNVVDKQNFVYPVSFPPNVDRVSVTSDEVQLRMSISKEAPASMYRVYVSFALNPEELAFNRRQNAR